MPESTAKKYYIERSNLVAENPDAGVDNWGHGITPTLTENTFNKSFGDWGSYLKKFNIFMLPPKKVIGKGIKNIQFGLKTAKQYKQYAVKDLLQIKIENRPKVYESRIGDLFFKAQVSLDLPANWHVDKFINPNEYANFIADYLSQLQRSMDFTLYNVIKAMFHASAFNMCMPDHEYQRFILSSLATVPPVSGGEDVAPAAQIIHEHANIIKALCEELTRKITNKYFFNVNDFIPTKPAYKPFVINSTWDETNEENKNLLKKVLTNTQADQDDQAQQPSNTRVQSLRAFEVVLSVMLTDIITGEPRPKYWQGNKGNVVDSSVFTQTDQTKKQPKEVYKNVDPAIPSTRVMDKTFDQRPRYYVEASKDDLVLIMSQNDYNDFMGGIYTGYFGSQEMAQINFRDSVATKVREIIPVPGMVSGHAIILDHRAFSIIPHLSHSGTDVLNQRIATVTTLHQWFILGIHDQFVGVRIQMVNFDASPVDKYSLFFDYRDAAA